MLGRYFPPIEAIILFGESVRWETNLQLIVDVLMCDGRLDMPRNKYPIQNLPILACNTGNNPIFFNSFLSKSL